MLKKRLDALLCDPKHMKQKDDNFIKLLVPSFVGVLLCLACLVSMTWAWFGASVQSGSNRISAANYDLEVTVKALTGETSDTQTVTGVDATYTYQLRAGVTYLVTLTGSGNATVGFGDIIAGKNSEDPVYHSVTETIATEYATASNSAKEISFYIASGEDAILVIKPMWGKPDVADGSTLIENNGNISILGGTEQIPKGATLNIDEEETESASSASSVSSSPTSQVADTSSTASQVSEVVTSAVASTESEQNVTETPTDTNESSQVTTSSENTLSQDQAAE